MVQSDGGERLALPRKCLHVIIPVPAKRSTAQVISVEPLGDDAATARIGRGAAPVDPSNVPHLVQFSGVLRHFGSSPGDVAVLFDGLPAERQVSPDTGLRRCAAPDRTPRPWLSNIGRNSSW